MTTDETLPETGRRSPLRRRVVGALAATIAIVTMVPTAALAQSSEDPAPLADNYFTASGPTTPPTTPPATPPPSVGESGSPPACEAGQRETGSPGNVCAAVVRGESGGASGSLPQTGSSPSMLLGLGALAMVAGAMLLAAARRRRHQLAGMPLSG